MRQEIRRHRRVRTGFQVLLVLVALISAACGQANQANHANQAKRYHLKGRIVAVKAATNALTIDGDDIPGFMSAMTMDYSVRSAQSLTGLNPGDEITADIVVPPDTTAYLENIVVTKKGSGPGAPAGARGQ